ncbi:MAG TPA: type II toxin-antitoxin system prevent-host-death family antitoxin [Candidatus Limnocylindria bacterium]|nr:type II toxin-antitoxin system prevent-host-death family antitoxin [Candidatus Limnocylindria bacterium]
MAEAKRRFSELIERVGRGERFLISRRGKPALALVPASEGGATQTRPLGLAAVAGALADWNEIDAVVAEIYAARRCSKERTAPEL